MSEETKTAEAGTCNKCGKYGWLSNEGCEHCDPKFKAEVEKNKLAKRRNKMIDIYDEEYVLESAGELAELRALHPTLSHEPLEWMQRLWHYATGKIKWDTGKDWVCEDHPHLPYGHLVYNDKHILVECEGAGMPPLRPNKPFLCSNECDEPVVDIDCDDIKQCSQCGGLVLCVTKQD